MMAILYLFLAITCLAFLTVTQPFIHWPSFRIALRETLTSHHISSRERRRMLMYLVRDAASVPFLSLFWWIDRLFFCDYRSINLDQVVFLIGQPRSGTTLLLRTLAEDDSKFVAVKHIEWRYPFLVVWRIFELLHLRHMLERVSYWPNTPTGRIARKLHFHVLGNHEEHGIFFEERFYQHYFLFRRFPFPNVLDQSSRFECLPSHVRQRMLRTFREVVQKVFYCRGSNEFWITKENEDVSLYRYLASEFPNARFVALVRDPAASLPSFNAMSVTCTAAKHGVDPRKIPGWNEANMRFRREESERFVTFVNELEQGGRVLVVPFDELVNDISWVVSEVYDFLGLRIGSKYAALLFKMQKEQSVRDRGYKTTACDTGGFERFSDFVSQQTYRWKKRKLRGTAA